MARSVQPSGILTVLSAIMAGLAVAAMTAADVPSWMPGPAISPRPGAVMRNADCERCHADVAAEWRASRHRSAFTGEVFQRAFAYEPLPMCQACHAPDLEGTRSTHEVTTLRWGAVKLATSLSKRDIDTLCSEVRALVEAAPR